MREWTFENHGSKAQETEESASSNKSEIAALTENVKRNHRQLKEGLDRLQNSLDNLRLVTKYRVFDLEATRRENAHLKKMLGREGDEKP